MNWFNKLICLQSRYRYYVSPYHKRHAIVHSALSVRLHRQDLSGVIICCPSILLLSPDRCRLFSFRRRLLYHFRTVQHEIKIDPSLCFPFTVRVENIFFRIKNWTTIKLFSQRWLGGVIPRTAVCQTKIKKREMKRKWATYPALPFGNTKKEEFFKESLLYIKTGCKCNPKLIFFL